MKGYIIFDAESGTHVVSNSIVRGIGFDSSGSSEQQAQAVAAMTFGLLANAAEAAGHPDGQHTEDPATRYHALGIQVLEDDRTPNAAGLTRFGSEQTRAHVFRHAVFPLACVTTVPPGADDEAGDFLAERLCKAFVFAHGSDYLSAKQRGASKPFRKLFAAAVERATLEAASLVLRRLLRIRPDRETLVPDGHYMIVVSTATGTEGRWALQGVADAGRFTTRFGAFEQIAESREIRATVAAIDGYLAEIAAADDGPVEAMALETSAAVAFSAVLTPDLSCVFLSSLRRAALEDAVLCERLPGDSGHDDGSSATSSSSAAAVLLRSMVHALAKLRTSLEPVGVVVQVQVPV